MNPKIARNICVLVMVAFIASGCASSGANQPAAASPIPASPTTQLAVTIEPPVLKPSTLPLAEVGPYFPGKRQYQFEYPRREGGKLGITVWYPAVKPAGYAGTVARDADPDSSGAPYPLLLSATNSANEFAAHLVSHGFVVAGVDGQKPSDLWGNWLVDYPLEILAALDYIATNKLEGLAGTIDADHAGVYGYSFDGYNALAMSGARIAPDYYREQCAQANAVRPPLDERWVRYICAVSSEWDEFADNAGDALTQSKDGLWQPMTDARIRAVMPMAPEGAWLFGKGGLAAVDRPTLVIGAIEDRDYHGCPYLLEAVPIFQSLSAPERGMVSFVGREHMMIWDPPSKAQIGHFAVAFFGHHLQGRLDYAAYYSEAFVSQYPDLIWGPAPDERSPFD